MENWKTSCKTKSCAEQKICPYLRTPVLLITENRNSDETPCATRLCVPPCAAHDEEALHAWIADFAKEHGYETWQDLAADAPAEAKNGCSAVFAPGYVLIEAMDDSIADDTEEDA